ncbi:MAG: TonB-dependent receptor [candidate division KSB1 bacterium]|nr:TonB-dependent receptor [candidate division KSB1 bacterium]
MRYRKFLFTFLILLLPVVVFAGTTGKIAGKVIDKATGEPLPAANVLIEGTTMGAASDLNGEYFILNVPVGTYSLRATMMGYKTLVKTSVRVNVDLTTTVNFEMELTVLDMGETVTVVAERPLIEKDLTASRSITTSVEIENIPLNDLQDIIELTPGIVEGHARGGRAGELVYQIDGIVAIDPMTNAFDTQVPEFAIEELSVITGGFSAEYSNAQSGIVNIVTKEGSSSYTGRLRYRTSDYGSKLNRGALKGLSDHHRLKNFEFSLGGPDPLTNYLLKIYRNRLNFFVAGEILSTEGRFDGGWRDRINLNAKLTYRPTVNDKILIGLLRNWEDYGLQQDYMYSRRYYKIIDHLPEFKDRSYNLNMTWTHTLSQSSLFEFQLGIYDTRMHYNVNERIDEDRNGNGILDPKEDLNWNGILDPYGTDLFRDENDNDYIDASEIGPSPEELEAQGRDRRESNWRPWEEVVIGNAQDPQGFYIYGTDDPRYPTTFYRLRWNNDKKTNYTIKASFTSQITTRQKIKTGFEYTLFDLYDHDVDLASGGNIYGQNIGKWKGHGLPGQTALRPVLAGLYFEDKMEYEGMILNAGLRFDYFNPEFDNYPSDPKDPVTNPTTGGEVKNPRSVKAKYYWSPRLGIAHPITERDVLYFNYGRYFQIPRFDVLYRNINWDLTGAFPMIGNPDIRPETTYSYELGVKHQFTDDLKLEVTGFYKDIQGLTDTRQMYYTANSYYTDYINIDYGNVRGFEVSLYKRYSHYVGGEINYTYSIAKGKSSSNRQNYDYTWAGNIIPKEEHFLDWDQRHTITANLNIRVPEKRRLLFGTPILDDAGVNLTCQYGSGLPYTPPQRTRIVLINTKRRPHTVTWNLMADKRFTIVGSLKGEVFLWVDNLFDKKNLRDIADVDWYEADMNGDGKPDHDPMGKYRDPSVWSEGRVYRLGIGFLF